MKIILLLLTIISVNSFRICHINDFYDFGSDSRLCDFQENLRNAKCDITTFSGDVLSYRDFTKGKIVADILNSLNITIAIPGNHEFDLGKDKFFELVNNTNFPWIISNVPSLNLPNRIVINNYTFIGLWHKNLQNVMLNKFDIQEKIDINSTNVIALTHMDFQDDIDTIYSYNFRLILGGHDHDLNTPILINKTVLIKALSDYREIHLIDIVDNRFTFSKITVNRGKCVNKDYDSINNYTIPYTIDTIDKSIFNPTLKKVLYTFIDYYPLSHLILQNKGLFRENKIFQKGEKTKSFIINSITTEVTCSYYDTFLALYYGIFINRIQFVSMYKVNINFLVQELDIPNITYRIVINNFLEKGKDGFHMFTNCKNTNYGSYEMYDLLN